MSQDETKTFDSQGILRESGAETDDPSQTTPDGVEVLGAVEESDSWVLSNSVLALLHKAQNGFGAKAKGLDTTQSGDGSTSAPAQWSVGATTQESVCRQVSVAGPASGPALIRGLNSAADAYIASFDAFMAPSWSRVLEGQKQLRDAISGVLTCEDPNTGQFLSMSNLSPPELILRPRSIRNPESNVQIGGEPLPAGFFDVIVFAKHNAHDLVHGGGGLRLNLAGIQTIDEAALWNEFLDFLVKEMTLDTEDIQITFEVGTVHSTQHCEEYLYALRSYAVAVKLSYADLQSDLVRQSAIPPGLGMPLNGYEPIQHLCGFLAGSAHKHGALALGPLSRQFQVAEHKDSLEGLHGCIGQGADGVSLICPMSVESTRGMVRETLEGPNQLSAVDGTPMPTLDAFACTELTSEILEKQLGVALQFLGNWLTGTDHFVSDGEVSSMASAERVRMAAHAWDRQPDAENQPSAKKLLSNEVARLRQDLGDDGFRGKGLGQARTILRRAIAAEDASEALGSRAYAQLERLLT